MKGLKLSLVVLAATLLAFGLSGMAYAFHSGGVAECEGCHTMHNSLDGGPMTGPRGAKSGTIGVAKPYLLQGSDASSTCLNCHAADASSPGSYHIMTYPVPGAGSAPVNNSPGGDFAWLQKDYSWIPRGTNPADTENSYGYQHGHNVYAGDYGLVGDGRFTWAPGSGNTYSAGNTFGCQSCHDPHGRYRVLTAAGTLINTTGLPIYSSGSYGADAVDGTYAVGTYRLLAGKNYVPKSYVGGPAFTQDPIFAAAPRTYNQTETSYAGTRVAYGKNSSEWCANCHNAMHSIISSVPNALVHKTGETLGSDVSNNYNAYKWTGNTTGVQATAFLSLVPFQVDNLSQNSQLKTYQGRDGGGAANGANWTLGTGQNDRVVCFSCHRAHASGFDSIARWSNGNEFLTIGNTAGVPSYPDPTANPAQAMGRTVVETQAAYGGRAVNVWAAPYQRSLCNKCHFKD